MWNPKEETRSRDELSRLQNQRLRDLVRRVHERVPFYKRKMAERGVSPSDIREISDITKLPFTTKDEMRDAYPLGLLAEVIRTIADAGINLQALSLAETRDFGMLRLILDDPEKAQHVLKWGGFVVQVTDVIAVEVEDKPGGLSLVLEILNSGGINIEYAYASIERKQNNAIIILRIEDSGPAIDVL